MRSPHSIRRSGRGGFTLLELLLVIGIIALLAGILLPAGTKAYSRSIALRTQADLQAIASGLEAYKADFGVYPPITAASTGAAVLGKALLGPYDAAHYYTAVATVDGGLAANNTLQNPPETFDTGKTYKAGDVVKVGGTGPTFASYTTGIPQPTVYVSVRNDNTNHSPIAPANLGGEASDYWWALFMPFDGQDGIGVRSRLAAAAVDSSNNPVAQPHAPAGKVYGPYLDPERFKTNGVAILDRYGSPVLYFTKNQGAKETVANGLVARFSYPRIASPAASAEPLSTWNANDNLGVFANPAAVGETPAQLFANVAITMGDLNTNGGHDADEPEINSVPFLLWTAGPDKVFGPSGTRNPTGSFRRGDYFDNGTNPDSNRITLSGNDDVTNFR